MADSCNITRTNQNYMQDHRTPHGCLYLYLFHISRKCSPLGSIADSSACDLMDILLLSITEADNIHNKLHRIFYKSIGTTSSTCNCCKLTRTFTHKFPKKITTHVLNSILTPSLKFFVFFDSLKLMNILKSDSQNLP
jgi:hypothetical protein